MGAPPIGPAPDNMDRNSSPEGVTATSEDAEWEYEYDETETEDYYFTLDITKQDTPSRPKPDKAARKAQRLASKGRKTVTGAIQKPNPAQSTTKLSGTGTSKPKDITQSILDRGFQLLDLHTDNPLILLGERLYSCHWSTDLGTQFHVARSGVVEGPLRPGRVLDVVGITRARLVGSPAAVRLRQGSPATKVGASAENAIPIEEEDNVEVAAETPNDVLMQSLPDPTEQSFETNHEASHSGSMTNKSFFEQLASITRKRAATENIPSDGLSNYDPSSNRTGLLNVAVDAEQDRAATPLSPGKPENSLPRLQSSGQSPTSKTTTASAER